MRLTGEVCKVVVERDDLVRGFEFSKGKYIQITEEELESLEAEANNAIEFLEFVPVEKPANVASLSCFQHISPSMCGIKSFVSRIFASPETQSSAVSSLELSGKDRLDALKFLAETNRRLHEARAGREFKVVVSVLGLFGAIVLAFVEKKLTCVPILMYSGIAVFALIIVGWAWPYFRLSARANKWNWRLAEDAENIIIKATGLGPRDSDNPNLHRWFWGNSLWS